ncbi:hypothetical protein [Enterobacter asburiae]|uniref:hypothetical protein n=1 Tax=Enterobacter asburiae TaxID=61645 RepID=UPI0018C3164D|nr:hypothetical protein [Enterobacter asburiae]MBF9770444.1 hypothetical protein [Enterobacter asburiae]
MKPSYEELEEQLNRSRRLCDAALANERVWETAMMQACGEDGPKSVSDKFSELEARCAALAEENASLDNFIAASCFVYAGELGYWPAIDHSPEIPATNQLSVAESQFLTDVMTAAGLLSCGKRDKQLAQRLADFCVSKRGASSPAQLRKGVQS